MRMRRAMRLVASVLLAAGIFAATGMAATPASSAQMGVLTLYSDEGSPPRTIYATDWCREVYPGYRTAVADNTTQYKVRLYERPGCTGTAAQILDPWEFAQADPPNHIESVEFLPVR